MTILLQPAAIVLCLTCEFKQAASDDGGDLQAKTSEHLLIFPMHEVAMFPTKAVVMRLE